MPRCAASFVHAVLIIPVPPMNRTFMEEVVAGTWAASPVESAPNLWQKALRLGRGATLCRSRAVAMRLGHAEYEERLHGGYVVGLERACRA